MLSACTLPEHLGAGQPNQQATPASPENTVYKTEAHAALTQLLHPHTVRLHVSAPLLNS